MALLPFYPCTETIGRRFNMAKQRGSPDRRGMGAQSDFIAEPFVPSEQYITEQRIRVQKLLDAGMSAEEVAKMFSVPFDLLSGEKPNP